MRETHALQFDWFTLRGVARDTTESFQLEKYLI